MISNDSIDSHLHSLSANGLSTNTLRAYRADLTGLLTWLNTYGPPIADWCDLEMASGVYLNQIRQTAAPKTTTRKLTSIRGWARTQGQPEFLSSYKAPKPGRPNPHPLPEGMDGVARMCTVARGPLERALVALCGYCGLRVGEATTAVADDLDRPTRDLRVRGKGDVTRYVPVGERAWVVLKEAWALAEAVGPDTRIAPFANSTARARVTAVGRRAGISVEVASHDLRATFATAAYERSGHDIRAVQELLGHAKVETTMRYVGVGKHTLRAAVG